MIVFENKTVARFLTVIVFENKTVARLFFFIYISQLRSYTEIVFENKTVARFLSVSTSELY